ncbi:helix-turn-helix transcriptional regulator [Bradyrhizobium cenepequi]
MAADDTDVRASRRRRDKTQDALRPRKMLSLSEVTKLTGLSKATIFRLERDGRFPRGTFISPRRKIWFEDQIVPWMYAIEGQRFPRVHRGGKPRRATPADVEA